VSRPAPLAAILAGAFAALVLAAVAPEWRAGAALRRLREGEALLLDAAREADPARRSSILRDAEEVLGEAEPRLPHDPRPSYLLGSVSLLRNDAAGALEHYRRSLRIEERPETDLNLSRAYTALGRPEAAAQDAVRAVWLAPNLLRDLPPAAQGPVRKRVGGMARRLKRGKGLPPALWPE
jgi:tetratricopeptide (TPR) repeat protein